VKQFLILGNWKENKTLEEAMAWADIVITKIQGVKNTKIAVCPPYPLIPFMAEVSKQSPLKIGAQDISLYDKGTYTGEVSGELLKDYAAYIIVGHSERRRFFNETNEIVATKVKQVLKYGLIPVVCLADTVTEQGIPVGAEATYNEVNFTAQITSIFMQLTGEEQNKVIFSFEPPTAISSQTVAGAQGTAASLATVETIINKIKTLTGNNSVLYGGSVKSSNVLEYLKSPVIDGVMPGSASMDAEEFIRLVLTVDEANQ